MGRSVNISSKSRGVRRVKRNPLPLAMLARAGAKHAAGRAMFRRNPKRDGIKMALSVANKIHQISEATLNGPDRGYLISEVSIRINRHDYTGALSVAWQSATKLFPEVTPYTMDRAAEDIVFKIARDYTNRPLSLMRKNPRRTTPLQAFAKRHGKKLTVRYVPRKHHVMRKNPSMTKHIHLQEKRGAGWITLAMFPIAQKAMAVRIAKQFHRKHPGKTLRLFS